MFTVKLVPLDWQNVSMRWHFSCFFSVCYHRSLSHKEGNRIDREDKWSSREIFYLTLYVLKLKVKSSLIPGSLHLYINWLKMWRRLPNIHKKIINPPSQPPFVSLPPPQQPMPYSKWKLFQIDVNHGDFFLENPKSQSEGGNGLEHFALISL